MRSSQVACFGKTPSLWPALLREVSPTFCPARDSIDLVAGFPQTRPQEHHFLVAVIEPKGSRLRLSGLLLHHPEETMRILAGTAFALCLADRAIGINFAFADELAGRGFALVV